MKIAQCRSNEHSLERCFDPLNWVMVILSWQVLHILQQAIWLRMLVVGHTSESTIWYGLKITVSSIWWIMCMSFFETVSCSKCFVGVGGVAYKHLIMIMENHIIFCYLCI